MNNGGCQDLCLLTPKGHVNCSCRGERVLQEDFTCKGGGGGWERGGTSGCQMSIPPSHPTCRLLWYPEGGHALAGVETEANVFVNCARWLLRHLGQPRWGVTGQHSP